ncbi:biopolymer transporter ExbD [Acetobacteraceae bacterium KSS8]|uniref:Biopolymer transporter ExbD n=1 Tax=Endosaccharibacter trunci TaxID=2812733 RepID=A0ABT1W8E3_9PROT|nr:biopolymer transporter ExbD [Acetobacteraceae bacterium KSS8]
MAMNVGSSDGDEDEVVSAINTTPLVDVMLVLLIIFLITIPVVTHTVKVNLPKDANQEAQTKPDNVTIAVNQAGTIFWDTTPLSGTKELLHRLEQAAVKKPQPEVQIRGDALARYESVGKVVFACQQAGISKVGFITEPPPRGG